MVLEHKAREDCEFLTAAMHSDRARQFVTRLGWNLNVDSLGWEVDEYDDGHSEIVMVSSGALHLASCRLRLAKNGTMLEDHFSDVFRNGRAVIASAREDFFELTRLVTNPDLLNYERSDALSALLAKVRKFFASKSGKPRVFAIIFPQVLRLMERRGVECVCLEDSSFGGNRIMLVEILVVNYCASSRRGTAS